MKLILGSIILLLAIPVKAIAQKEWTINKYGKYILGQEIGSYKDCNSNNTSRDSQGRKVCSFSPSFNEVIFERRIEHVNLAFSSNDKLIEISFILFGTNIDSHLETVKELEFEYGKFIVDEKNKSKPISRRVLEGNRSYLMTYLPVYYDNDLKDFSFYEISGARVYSVYKIEMEK